MGIYNLKYNIRTTNPYLTMKNFHWLPHKGTPHHFFFWGQNFLNCLNVNFTGTEYFSDTKKHLMFAEMLSLKYKGKNNVPVSALSIPSKNMHCTPRSICYAGTSKNCVICNFRCSKLRKRTFSSSKIVHQRKVIFITFSMIYDKARVLLI